MDKKQAFRLSGSARCGFDIVKFESTFASFAVDLSIERCGFFYKSLVINVIGRFI
jgi:hypothetical protein